METKPWYMSKTIWGTLITLAGALLPAIGKMGADNLADSAVQIAGGVAAAIGGVLTIYGRYKATKTIK